MGTSYITKWSWPNLKYYCCVCLEGLWRTAKAVRIVGLRIEMRTRDLSSMKLISYPFASDYRSYRILEVIVFYSTSARITTSERTLGETVGFHT